MNTRNWRLILVTFAALCSYVCFGQDDIQLVDDSAAKPSPPPGDLPVEPEAPVDPEAPADPSEGNVEVDNDSVEVDKKGSSGELQADDGANDADNKEETKDDKPEVEQPIVRMSCYQCNTTFHGEKCMSSEASDLQQFLQPCPTDKKYERCRKSHQNIQGDVRLIRSCATLGSVQTGEDTCYERTGSLKILIETCECFNKDPNQPCNSATQITRVVTSLPLVIASLFFALRR